MSRRVLQHRAGLGVRGASALAVQFAAFHALAGPPLLTDDPETLAQGRFELNTAYTVNLSPRSAGGGGRTWEQEAPLFDLNYGFAEGVQLKFELPVAVLDPADGGGTRAGLGDLSLGAKLRLAAEEDAILAASIYPAIGIPTGNRRQGLGGGDPTVTLPAQIGRHFLEGKLFVYADGGYQSQVAEGGAEQWFAGVAAEYEVRGVVLCGELHCDLGARGVRDDSLINLGFKWALFDGATLIGSAGRSLNPSPESGSSLLAYLGVQWSF